MAGTVRQGPGPRGSGRSAIDTTRASLYAAALIGAALLAGAPAPAATPAITGSEAYEALGIEPRQVLSGTVLNARTTPSPARQGIALVSYFTGSRKKEDAVNVRLAVLERRGGKLVALYERDLGVEHAGGVAGGDLQVVDLDLDEINEIVVSWDSYADPLIEQRLGEVIVHGADGFRTAWSGPVEYDATRAAREVPPERRDRWQREIDIGATLATRGETLVFARRVDAVAGERLPRPKVVRETFPFRSGGDAGR